MSSALIENSGPATEKTRHLVAGRYRTLHRIGRGRLGEIFAALDESFEQLGVGQHRAVQIIPEGVVQNNKLFNRLNLGYSELRASSHPNFVDYIHLGRDGRFGYLVMELLDGASLRHALKEAEVLPLEEAKPVIRGAGEALRLLHDRNIVHGDLSTRNVFITADLEIRLLDVLPIDPAEPLVRGMAASNPFTRVSIDDDVFSLACLAYEMLSGKHPFNYRTLAEARAAGVEAERSEGIGNREWHAIQRALSFDDDNRTHSVAEFMRDFGIDGTERLRPGFDEPAVQVPAVFPPTQVSGPAIERAIGPAEIEQPLVHIAPVSAIDDWPATPRPPQKRSSPWRTALLGMLLAGLCAWSYFGEPEELAVAGIGYLDERLNLGLTRQSDAIIDIPAIVSVPTATGAQSVGVDSPEAAAPAAVAPVAPDESAVGPPNPEAAATSDAVAADMAQTSDKAVPVASAEVESTTADVIAVPNQVADDPVTASPGLAPVLTFPATQITVSERAGAARIVIQRNGNSDTPVTWWTSDDSASADDDFIAVSQRTLSLPANEDNDVILVPLVNDNLPERRESFFVNFGFYDAQAGRIEHIASVRVDIIDDD